MKLRPIPILITVAVSAVVLFGGWFTYHTVAMEDPLNRMLNGTSGVEQVQTSIDSKKAVFDLTLNENANLREIVSKIHTDGSSVIGTRELDLNVTSKGSKELDDWWSHVLFDVAQAMDAKQYASIPAVLKDKSASMQGLVADTQMDDHNVYIRLSAGGFSKYEILPRNPEKMGVWPNE